MTKESEKEIREVESKEELTDEEMEQIVGGLKKETLEKTR